MTEKTRKKYRFNENKNGWALEHWKRTTRPSEGLEQRNLAYLQAQAQFWHTHGFSKKKKSGIKCDLPRKLREFYNIEKETIATKKLST